MQELTFITGNQAKADYMAQYIDHPVTHKKIDLDEIQTLDLRAVAEHKARQAYALIGTPILVEDTSLEFSALGRFPGTFIKFLLDETSPETICRMLDGLPREAVGRTVFAYCDDKGVRLFEGSMKGTIAMIPAGERGFGWDKIFVPEGYTITKAELSEADYKTVYVTIKPFAQFKDFLNSIIS